MNNENAFTRLSNIFTLLCTPQEDASLSNIKECLDIPKQVLEDDIENILRNPIFSHSITEGTSINPCDFGFPMNTTPICISHVEKSLLKKYYPHFVHGASTVTSYIIKESPTVVSQDFTKLCDKIQSAIDNQYLLKISYRTRKTGSIINYEVAPQLLYHNINDGRIYLIHYNDRLSSFRLDYILSVQELKEQKNTNIMPKELLVKFDYLWGMDYQADATPIHVKLRIDAFSQNLLQKIKNDTIRRKYGNLYQEGDFWYYEDDIIGINAFRSWVNQFGYSVIVLVPEFLARDIYTSALTRMKNYKQNSFTD